MFPVGWFFPICTLIWQQGAAIILSLIIFSDLSYGEQTKEWVFFQRSSDNRNSLFRDVFVPQILPYFPCKGATSSSQAFSAPTRWHGIERHGWFEVENRVPLRKSVSLGPEDDMQQSILGSMTKGRTYSMVRQQTGRLEWADRGTQERKEVIINRTI